MRSQLIFRQSDNQQLHKRNLSVTLLKSSEFNTGIAAASTLDKSTNLSSVIISKSALRKLTMKVREAKQMKSDHRPTHDQFQVLHSLLTIQSLIQLSSSRRPNGLDPEYMFIKRQLDAKDKQVSELSKIIGILKHKISQ